jgi:hypothetical protein
MELNESKKMKWVGYAACVERKEESWDMSMEETS